ncbi:hypothetical protein VZG28_02440 [Synechococcus elongatus IITB4]|uniref:hypothetical protein n=1 Tax=Synechococcus elongatus TaxID=32046 RepID=UPI0030CCBFA0
MADYKLPASFFVEVNGQSLEFCDRQSALEFLQRLYQPKEQQWRVISRSSSDHG